MLVATHKNVCYNQHIETDSCIKFLFHMQSYRISKKYRFLSSAPIIKYSQIFYLKGLGVFYNSLKYK